MLFIESILLDRNITNPRAPKITPQISFVLVEGFTAGPRRKTHAAYRFMVVCLFVFFDPVFEQHPAPLPNPE